MDSDEYGSYVMVTFYDTNKGDEDVDINQALMDKILEDMIAAFQIHVIILRFVTTIFCYCYPPLPSYAHWLYFAGGTNNRIVRYAHRRVR